jgi:tetratricopeptide (TPR) repeat protein/4-amino-4-deoxy-L-arabinose transferase-like glycosyltransferase
VALIVRLIHLWQIRASPFFSTLMGDARAYDEWARRIAAGDWLGGEVFYQAPLYPYFLGTIYAIAGRDLTIVRVCQAVLGSAACVFVALTAWRLFSTRAAIVAGVGMAIYAPAVFFDGLIQKSVLDVFLTSAALWILATIVAGPERSGLDQGRTDLSGPPTAARFMALGLTMGALSLTRENALVLVLVVLGWIVASGFSRTSTFNPTHSASAFLLGLALVLLPVAARNYAVGGGLYLTTSQFGPNFYIGNNARADGTYASLRPGRGSPEYERQDATELAERAVGRTLTPAEVSSYWTERANDFISSEPAAWLTLMSRKVVLLINAGEMLDTESQASYAEWSWPLKATGWFTHFGVLVPLATIGVWATWPDRRRLAIFYALAIAYAASVVVFYVFARYRFPLVPMLFPLAAAGLLAASTQLLAALGQHFFTRAGTPPPARSDDDASPQIKTGSSARHGRGRLRQGASVLITATISLAVLCNWPLLSTSLMKAITETNLATALYENKQLDEAITHYERAIALRPDYAPAYANLGAALRSKGRLSDAVAAHETSIALQPDNPDAHFNLANALLDLNRPREAAEHFRLAGRQGPAAANVENNLGIALAAEGRLAEAAAAFRRALAAEPGSARAHRNLGDALISMGQFVEGLGHLRRAAELDPKNVSFRYDVAVALLEGGQPAQAIDEFRAALAIDPTFAPAHNNLGVALGTLGRLDEAIGHFREALRLRPGYADADRNLQMAVQARAKTQG